MRSSHVASYSTDMPLFFHFAFCPDLRGFGLEGFRISEVLLPVVVIATILYSRWEVQNVRGNSTLEHAIHVQFTALDSLPFAA